jgi:hypothetical protein
VHHRTIQINHQPDATVFQFITLTFVYSSTPFGRFPAHHQELNDCSGSHWFYFRIVVTVVLCSWSGRPTRPRTQHNRCLGPGWNRTHPAAIPHVQLDAKTALKKIIIRNLPQWFTVNTDTTPHSYPAHWT